MKSPKEFLDFTSSPIELRNFVQGPVGQDLLGVLDFFVEDGRDRLETHGLGDEEKRHRASEIQGWIFACRYIKQILENLKEPSKELIENGG